MFTTLQQALEFLTYQKNNPHYNTLHIEAALQVLGNPQHSFKSVHITGTNGKGSVTRMIYQVLREAGYSVWVFLSPHLLDVRERFIVDDEWIDDQSLIEIENKIAHLGLPLSRFEKYVTTAFLYFQLKKVDFAVIEVWVWARHDATNVLNPAVSVITNLWLDHPKTLGVTIDEIAYHKWAIIKPWKPVVVGVLHPFFEKEAQEKGSELIFSQREIPTNMIGNFQKNNAGIAYDVCRVLWIDEKTILWWLQKVRHKGRLDYVLPNLLVDGAHNSDGLVQLKEYISTVRWNFENVYLCFSLKKTREVTRITDIFWKDENFIIVDYFQDILEPLESLQSQMKALGIRVNTYSPEIIWEKAKKEPRHLYVVFGSLYMIGQFLRD